jgi:hypothetical protein
VNVTEPVGAMGVPAPTSVTTTLQLVGTFTGTDGGLQLTVVTVGRIAQVTVIMVRPELLLWEESEEM